MLMAFRSQKYTYVGKKKYLMQTNADLDQLGGGLIILKFPPPPPPFKGDLSIGTIHPYSWKLPLN
jgi:hypothetical protein